MSDTSELIVALIAPAGADRAEVITAIEKTLQSLAFRVVPIRLSKLLERADSVWSPLENASEGTRIAHLQEVGNNFRASLKDGAGLARAGIIAIREQRLALTGDPNIPAKRVAYLLDQLKNPAEVRLLRNIYGSSFFAIACHAPESKRETALASIIATSEGHGGNVERSRHTAREIIRTDDADNNDFGQNTRDTYPLADLFVDVGVEGAAGPEVNRFFELTFGHPFHTPTPPEYAMHQARAAALRSSDESRQVGAAIVTDDGDVIAVGSNEVPIRGGGLYWPNESPEARDQALVKKGEDRAGHIKTSALRELIERMQQQKMLAQTNETPFEQAKKLLPHLKGTQFINIGEFSRPVHAEMAALVDAAKRGVSVDKHRMYVTTFPCHNCAKHLIASGIREIIYLEPYPKSRAHFLHGEEIELDPEPGQSYGKRLVFRRFSGIGPRYYQTLFGMSSRGAKYGIPLSEWEGKRNEQMPRYITRNAALAYTAAECEEIENLKVRDFRWDPGQVCPLKLS